MATGLIEILAKFPDGLALTSKSDSSCCPILDSSGKLDVVGELLQRLSLKCFIWLSTA
jgi:hypothetical protein